MHISDGMLDPLWILLWWGLALVFIAIGVMQIRTRANGDLHYLPMIALMGAAIMVISVWHIPVPVTGSCSHPVGTPMAAIIVGPFPTVVISALALFFQMFVGHGGLTTLGANTFSMGIVGTFTGVATWVLLRKLKVSIFWAAGLAGAVGSMLTYVTTAFELAVSLHPEALLHYWGIFAMGFIPTQVPLTIIEFVFTGLVVRYIAEVRPDMMTFNRTAIAPIGRE